MSKRAALLFPLLASLACCGLFVNYDTIRNPDGTHDTEFPGGDKPPASADLSWNLATLTSPIGILTNVAYSADISDCCLSGTDESTATITIENCSGDDAATNGWTVSGSHPDKLLANAGTDGDLPGSGAFALRATVAAGSAVSSCINWSYITAPTSDTLAPPIPTGLTAVGSATNEVTVEFDAVCDNHDGTQSGSGTVTYNIDRDATGVDTVAVANCTTAALSQVVIGTSDSEASTQTGNNWDMTFGGAGLGGAADHSLVRNIALSGNASVIGKVTGLSSAATFPKVGVYIRESTAAGAAGYWLYFQGNNKVQMRGRATAGVNSAAVCDQAVSGLPVWIKLTRNQSAGTITGSYSTDGGEWTECATTALSVAATVQVGVFVNSTSAGVTANGDIEQVNIHALPRVSKAVATTVSGNFSVSAVDDDANESANSNGAIAAPGSAPGSTPITAVTLTMSTLRNITPGNGVQAQESDNWPITWAADGNQYAGFGDGEGFHNHPTLGTTRASIGVTRISGDKASYSANDVWKSGKSAGGFNGKTEGLLGANGKLYMSWDYAQGSGQQSGSREDAYEASSIWESDDFGVSWNEIIRWNASDWGAGDLAGFYAPTFLQFGQDYADARDAYVYVYLMEHDNATWNAQIPGGISLARVLLSNLESGNKAHWEYVTAIDANNVPTWSTVLANRIPVFQDTTDGNHIASVSYNKPLRRYILTAVQTQQAIPGAKIGIYDAAEPWGPWTQIVKQDPTTLGPGLATGANAIFWNFSNKWLSADGKTFVMVGTLPGSDQWGTVEGTFSTDTTPPPPPGAHRWNPGHYMKASGDPCDQNQTAYWNGVFNLMNNQMLDDPLIIGAHIGVCWGAINTTGSTHNTANMLAALDNANATGRKVIFQIQVKTFGSYPPCAAAQNPPQVTGDHQCTTSGWLLPADLSAHAVQMNQGAIAAYWRTPVMDRYIDTYEFLYPLFMAHPAFEGLMTTESAPSFGGVGSPADYSAGTLATQLKRLYAAAAAADGESNFFCNINSLGTEVAGLLEECYQQGVSGGGPDARPTPGYDQFTGASPAIRDYRTQMGGLWTVSNSTLCVTGGGTCAAFTPAEVIDNEQAHDTTHVPWITYQQETGRTWADIKAAINADPLLYLLCPANYAADGGCQ